MLSEPTRPTQRPRMWECGEPHATAIPTDEKNHWKVLLDSYLEADKIQCELWKDEVNVLLIFAGLFSAVVTAFLVESYKFLQPDTSAATLAAFDRLGDRIDNLALQFTGTAPNKAAIAPVVDAVFNPSAHAIRLNSLWFSSLVLSLTTVVLGLVALQWLRNHQRYHGISPRDALAVYRMRTKALRAWHIRWAFMSLPLLLLVALVLFFVGLVDFLLSINHAVAAPIAILVYFTLSLLFITTVLPTLQCLQLSVFPPSPKSDTDIPTQCPYKSPQSWIFHRFVTLSIRAVRWVFGHGRKGKEGSDKPKFPLHLPNIPLYFAFYSSPSKWTDYDTRWLRMRDLYSQLIDGKLESLPADSAEHPRRPIYDEAQILLQTISENMPSPKDLYASYHCFREVSENALSQAIERKEDYSDPKYDRRNEILRGYYWKHLEGKEAKNADSKPLEKFGLVSSLLPRPDAKLLHDENMMIFLQMHSSHNLPEEASRIVGAHLAELQSRILAYAFASPRTFASPEKDIDSDNSTAYSTNEVNTAKNQWFPSVSRQYINMVSLSATAPKYKISSRFAVGSLNGNEVPIESSVVEDAIDQYAAMFKSFVCQVVSAQTSLTNTTFTHPGLKAFLDVPAHMYRYSGTSISPFDTFSRFKPALVSIQESLKKGAADDKQSTEMSEKVDFLFLCTCFLMDQLFNLQSINLLERFDDAGCDFMRSFLDSMASYEDAIRPLDRLKDRVHLYGTRAGLPLKRGKRRGQETYIPTKFPPWLSYSTTR